jgi:hypothetical protein
MQPSEALCIIERPTRAPLQTLRQAQGDKRYHDEALPTNDVMVRLSNHDLIIIQHHRHHQHQHFLVRLIFLGQKQAGPVGGGQLQLH